MDKAKRTRWQNARPTLGLLIVNITWPWGMLQWRGVADAARECGVNLVCLPGGELHSPLGFDAQANVLYDLLDAERVEGLVLVPASIANYVGREEVVKFCGRYRPLPIVSVAAALEGVPSVLVDNYQGMYDAMTHLKVHGGKYGPSRMAWATTRRSCSLWHPSSV